MSITVISGSLQNLADLLNLVIVNCFLPAVEGQDRADSVDGHADAVGVLKDFRERMPAEQVQSGVAYHLALTFNARTAPTRVLLHHLMDEGPFYHIGCRRVEAGVACELERSPVVRPRVYHWLGLDLSLRA